MPQHLLSVHTVEGETREPMSEEEIRQFRQRLGVLEDEIKSAGAWVFSGRLHEPDTATVVRVSDGQVLTTDGPFAESKGREDSRRVSASPCEGPSAIDSTELRDFRACAVYR